MIVSRYMQYKLVPQKTKALIGRAYKSVTVQRQLESYRESQFLPTFEIDSGDFVHDIARQEDYVISAVHKEPYGNITIAQVATMLKCNHIIEVKGIEEVADDRGNLRKELVTRYQGVPCYLEQVDDKLRQIDAGILPDTDYLIYTTALDIEEEFQILIHIAGKPNKFKVIALDYVTFPRMLVMQISRDVRK